MQLFPKVQGCKEEEEKGRELLWHVRVALQHMLM